jgi:hypothetical protein
LNLEGNPVFLRAEVQQDKIVIPEFIDVIMDVTKEHYFTTMNMTDKEFKYDESTHVLKISNTQEESA